MISRIRVIALVGAGAISSAGICSLYLAYTLQEQLTGPSDPADSVAPVVSAVALGEADTIDTGDAVGAIRVADHPLEEQAFLVAFLANADPQVRTLAVWGLMSGEEDRQLEILEFVRQERDPEVRATLYRFLHGQRSINCGTLVELVRREEDREPWLAGCDLLAGVVQNGARPETREFFDRTIVPELARTAITGEELPGRIAAIIVLRRAGTDEAVEALREIIESSGDLEVVQAASSAVRFAATGQ